MFDLTGKCALVTGATGGIGYEIAKALHGQGAHVGLSGTREERLREIAHELGSRVSVLPCNLRSRANVDVLPRQAEEEMGSLDILVSNAGITRDNIMLRLKDEDWDDLIEVNLTSYFRMVRSSLRGMMKRRWGRIIAIASVVGVTGNPGQTNYAAAKAGIIGLSKALAQEVASRNITVNCIAPGFIATPMTDTLTEEQRQATLARIPIGELGSGADIAAGAVYLASDEAHYVTGQTLHINGGMAMI